MSDIATLSLDQGLIAIRSEIVYTLARLRADPAGATYVASFQALHDRWPTVFNGQLGVWDGEDIADAGVAFADDTLDDQTGGFLKDLLHMFPAGNAIRARFLSTDTTSGILRMGLQTEIARVEGWPDSIRTLAGAPGTHADAMAAAITQGRTALTGRTTAVAARADYQSTTAEHYVDDVNGARISLFGALIGYAAAHELPATWAHRFFKATTRRRAVVAPDVPAPTRAA